MFIHLRRKTLRRFGENVQTRPLQSAHLRKLHGSSWSFHYKSNIWYIINTLPLAFPLTLRLYFFGKLDRLTLFAFLPPSVSSPPLTGTCLGPPLQMNDWFWQDHVTSKRRKRGYGGAQRWKRHHRENWRSRFVLSISIICNVYFTV